MGRLNSKERGSPLHGYHAVVPVKPFVSHPPTSPEATVEVALDREACARACATFGGSVRVVARLLSVRAALHPVLALFYNFWIAGLP